MTDRDCNFNCLDSFYNELDQCPCMSGRDANYYKSRVRRTFVRANANEDVVCNEINHIKIFYPGL